MEIYNKRKFLSGIMGITIALSALIALVIKGFSLKLFILAVLIFLISISSIRKSISKRLTIQDRIEELDERNQEIELKSNALSFKICQYTVIFLEVISIILYGIYKVEVLIWMIIVLAFIVFVTFTSEMLSSIHYEKRI
ncbi:hypothetical protein [Bacillus andreraoultii]|uniref:hypothetical protein n=1 Tax=Bacillus andreraoultii TaxID=1499685 RepID=UPI00053A4A70|nr:hypothetical protein [Bacillus andreraoultii]